MYVLVFVYTCLCVCVCNVLCVRTHRGEGAAPYASALQQTCGVLCPKNKHKCVCLPHIGVFRLTKKTYSESETYFIRTSNEKWQEVSALPFPPSSSSTLPFPPSSSSARSSHAPAWRKPKQMFWDFCPCSGVF